MNKKQSRVRRRSIAFHENQLTMLEKHASKEGVNVSELVRKAVNQYLSLESSKEDIDFITDIIRQEVKAEIGKQANRLAAMLFKVGAITSSNYFFSLKTIAELISPSLRGDLTNINTIARKLGVDYMKQTVDGVVSFLDDGDAVEEAANKLGQEHPEKDF